MKKIVEEENKTKPLEIEEKIEQIISEKIDLKFSMYYTTDTIQYIFKVVDV